MSGRTRPARCARASGRTRDSGTSGRARLVPHADPVAPAVHGRPADPEHTGPATTGGREGTR
jgi:hypothetical protein